MSSFIQFDFQMFPFLKIFRLYTNKGGTEYKIEEHPKICGSIIVSNTISPFLIAQNEPWAHTASFSVGTGASLPNVKRLSHLVSRLRMNGTILPLPHTPSWRLQGHLYFILLHEYRAHYFFQTPPIRFSEFMLCFQPAGVELYIGGLMTVPCDRMITK
jgi:hypothetical protein